MQIAKSVNSEPAEKKSSDTMGTKHMIRMGVYKLKGSINVQLAQKTGFTSGDAGIIKECLRTLFENDVSSARPDGSMQIHTLYWWEHNCSSGQYSSARVHGSVNVALPETNVQLDNLSQYIVQEALPGLTCEVIHGL